MNMLNTGRIEVIDDRDNDFQVSSFISQVGSALPDISRKVWWADGWWGNQGRSSHCVAYSWMHYLEDGPVIQDALFEQHPKPFYRTKPFYDLCQLHDQWDGEDYEGTSVRAGAKILHHLDVIKSYHWASNLNEVIDCVKYIGPVIAGTKWYDDMFHPNSRGVISVSGKQQGGHAYVINGVDEELGLFRIKSSWGRGWGRGGHVYVRFDDFDRLLHDGGEACIAFENKMLNVPELPLS